MHVLRTGRGHTGKVHHFPLLHERIQSFGSGAQKRLLNPAAGEENIEMKPTMLWTADYSPEWEKKFSEIVDVKRAGFNVHNRANDYFNEDELIEQLKGCRIFSMLMTKSLRKS